MTLFNALLNGYFLFLCVLFVTGGLVPPASASQARLLAEMNQLGPWVAGFVALVLWRRLRDRDGTFGRIRFARVVGALADRVPTTGGPLYLFTAVWAVLLVSVSIRRHLAFDDNGDLAIFDQAFWNTIHGAFLRSSLIPGASGEVNIFSDHFDPLQLLLVPFYLVFPSPLLLLATQGLMLALGAVPLYWLARARFPDHPLLYTIFPVLYLLYLPLRGANRYDYHPSALVPPLFLFALYFMEKARWARMILFLVMAGLLKENMPIAGVTTGLYLLLVKRKRLLGLCLATLFGLWFYAGFAWIIPAFNPRGYSHFLRYSTFDAAPFGIFLAPLRHPLDFLAALYSSTDRKLGYLLYVFGPIAFLSWLSPTRALLGLPFLVQNLLSAAPHQTSLHTHHAAELIPFVFFSALGGASNLLRWLDDKRMVARLWEGARLRRALAGLLLASSLLFHGLPETFYLRLYSRTAHHERLDAALQMIPPSASLSTWTEILPHVAHRKALYRFPELGPGGGVDAEFVIVDDTLLPRTDRVAVAEALAALPARGYEKVLDQDGVVLFKKRAARGSTGQNGRFRSLTTSSPKSMKRSRTVSQVAFAPSPTFRPARPTPKAVSLIPSPTFFAPLSTAESVSYVSPLTGR